jgi:hypothetical protein
MAIGDGSGGAGRETGTVSVRVEVPEPLLLAMDRFLDLHPNWDPSRLVQVALAGFLVQNGSQDRAVIRCYLANLFPNHGGFAGQDPPSLSSRRLLNGSREAA